MADRNRFFPAPRLILAALVAGVMGSAVAVYVSESRSGNNAAPQAAAGGKDDVPCATNAGRAKAVAAKAVGQVAALQPADPPQSLKSLAFNGPDGKPMTIADHAGKTV